MVSIPVVLQFIKPYQRDRIVSFLNPESDPLGQGYQLIQSKIDFVNGEVVERRIQELNKALKLCVTVDTKKKLFK